MKVILFSTILVVGCAPSTPSIDESVPEPSPVGQRKMLTLDGDLEATKATKVMAPSADVYLGKYQRKRGWQRIKKLVNEGRRVKAGETILRFEFEAQAALPDIKNEIKSIEAEAEKARLAQQAQLRELKSSEGQLDLTEQAALLDTQGESVVSKRAQALFEFDHRIARFDARAVRRRIAAHKKSMASSADWYAERLKVAQAVLAKYHVYESRYVVKAPHDGYVRHGKHPWRRRRLKQGDRVPPGHTSVSIAQDARLTARFYIPEAQVSQVKAGQRIVISSLAGDARWETTVRTIEDIPQEIGFLRKDNELPNAREKAYVGFADLPKNTKGLASGTEIRVTISRQKDGSP